MRARQGLGTVWAAALTMAVVATGAWALGSWQTLAPLAEARAGHGAVWLTDKLYVFGGARGPFGDTVYPPIAVYDPATDSWSQGAVMSQTRKNLAAAEVGGILYAVGGDNDFVFRGRADAYDPETDTWTLKPASMIRPRSLAAAAALGGIIYVVGGDGFGTVEAYDPANDTWTLRASLNPPRAAVAAAVVNGVLYAVGGFDASGVSRGTLEAYDPAGNTWSTLSPMPTPRHDFVAAALGGKLYAIGGFRNQVGGLAAVEVYDPATDSWSVEADMPDALARHRGAASATTVYVAAGQHFSANASLDEVASLFAFTPGAPPDPCATDTMPPELAVWSSPGALWPPNHRLVDINMGVVVSDGCDASPAVTLVSVESSEPDDGLGDGDTAGDITGAALGTDDRVVSLRAERSGSGSGRTYTLTYRATDTAGNSQQATTQVVVPQRRR